MSTPAGGGLPDRPWWWWWRARHVLNSSERATLKREVDALTRRYAPEIRAIRRERLGLRLVIDH